MSEIKGMLHYKVEIKQEAVRLVREEHLTYAAVAAKLGCERLKESKYECECIGRKESSRSISRLEVRLRMKNALLKKFHTELRGVQLAQRNIGRSTTRGKNTK